MERRPFLARAAALAAAPLAFGATTPDGAGLIDTNVTLGDWPVRKSWVNSPADLVTRLRRHGVSAAWTANVEGVLHSDLAGANARLAEACARDGAGVLVPFGTVNPTFPDWADDVRRCHEVHRMPGLRLFPGYHGYKLEDPRFSRLLEAAAQRGLLVQIALTLEDERSQNPVLTAPAVTAAPLPELLTKLPAARVQLLNATSRLFAPANALLTRLAGLGVGVELATLEGVAGLENLLAKVPDLRMAFGSHTPYYYFESALLKLQESALTPAQLAAVRSGHARQLLASRP
jgi:predicted TIM-barrel fold metal-dependent hydrolase